MCLHIVVCLAGGNKGSKSRVGFMMKFSGNLKSPITEAESEKRKEKGQRERGGTTEIGEKRR